MWGSSTGISPAFILCLFFLPSVPEDIEVQGQINLAFPRCAIGGSMGVMKMEEPTSLECGK
ncbi:UNVERIFIED_CONTAM: hypothetical protein Slati_1342200 [Sesamum latifolium]|uniref:Uncharacterized protein n=1 Tax=Sesamum latifolium TaxID=2727402 RepID=A0AAW2XN57_9LAMI